MKKLHVCLLLCLVALPFCLSAQAPASAVPGPVVFNLWDRQRVNATQWFAATPDAVQYGHVDSLLRLSVQQRLRSIDWFAELSQNSELWLPGDAVSPVAAEGQLGLGGTYYAANGNNRFPAAGSFKQGYVRGHFFNDRFRPRIGRFEFLDGAETTPEDPNMAWVQTNRVAQRLIGNFGFSNGQRSLDGVDLHVSGTQWDVTAMGARAVQGVFNMNGNPELNTDVQYLAYSRYAAKKHLLVRGFAIGYHDGRTGVTKVDTRPASVRALDHRNIRVGTYGMSAIAAGQAGPVKLDGMFWGLVQNGRWGTQDHRAGAAAAEGGVQFTRVKTQPWLRGGWLRTSGDHDPNDNTHGTFFQVLPTPRNYARFPFFNMMNLSEGFGQLIDKPVPQVEVRSDLHVLRLTSAQDLWYLGGGSIDNSTFGFTGRPANGRNNVATMFDISADWQVTKRLMLTGYYAHVFGSDVVSAIYPRETDAQFGFMELNYRFSMPLGGGAKQP